MMREISLIDYLPPYVQEYNEIAKIMAAENPEFQLLWDIDGKTRNDMFILTATEDGIARFEKLVGINPSADDTLESRRLTVLTKWNDTTPYTYRYLINLLKTLVGDNYEVITNFSEYALEIMIFTNQAPAQDDYYRRYKLILKWLAIIIPANLLLTSMFRIDTPMSTALSAVPAAPVNIMTTRLPEPQPGTFDTEIHAITIQTSISKTELPLLPDVPRRSYLRDEDTGAVYEAYVSDDTYGVDPASFESHYIALNAERRNNE